MNAPVKSPQAAQSDLEGIFFVEATWEMEQLYRPDPWLAKSLAEFRNKRICGGLVRDTGRVIFPPASFCETGKFWAVASFDQPPSRGILGAAASSITFWLRR